MALDVKGIAAALQGIQSLINTLKVPFGDDSSDENDQFSKLIKSLENTKNDLNQLSDDSLIRNALSQFDQNLDGVAGNNIIFNSDTDNTISFKFDKTLSPSFGNSLPTVTADFNLDWSLNNPNNRTATFSNLKLNSLLGENSFIGNAFGNIKKALEPVQKLTSTLNGNINLFTNDFPNGFEQGKDSILDENHDGKITVLDIFKIANKYAPDSYKIAGLDTLVKFVEEADSVLKLVELAEDSGNITIPLSGTFSYDLNKQQFSPYGTINADITDSKFKEALSGLSNFSLNILKPETAFGLFLGQPNVDLFTYTMPKVEVSSPPDLKEVIKIPIVIPLLQATFGAKFNASINLGFGYDTRGLDQLLNSPSNAFNGFYVLDVNGNDNPELKLDGAFSAGLKLGDESLGAAIRGGGNVGVEADFFLATNESGKLYFSDIQPDNLFREIKGQVYAELEASADLAVGQALRNAVEGQLKLAATATGYLRKITKDAGIVGEGVEWLDKGVNSVKEAVGDAFDKCFWRR
jgi:hypothetical protein